MQPDAKVPRPNQIWAAIHRMFFRTPKEKSTVDENETRRNSHREGEDLLVFKEDGDKDSREVKEIGKKLKNVIEKYELGSEADRNDQAKRDRNDTEPAESMNTEAARKDVGRETGRSEALKSVEASDLIHNMSSGGVIPKDASTTAPDSFFRIMLLGNHRSKMQFLESLKNGRITVAKGEVNRVLGKVLKTRHYDDVSELMRVFRHSSFRKALNPTVETYAMVIGIYGEKGMLKEAFGAFFQMQRDGFMPNLEIFNILILACANAGDVDKAYGLLERMRRVGVVPDVHSYELLIRACASKGNVDLAFQVLHLMERAGIAKDQIIYAALLEVWCAKGNLNEALGLFEEMKCHGVWPNYDIFLVLIKLCAVVQRPRIAFELFGEMKEWELTPSMRIYTILIDACGSAMWPTRAHTVFTFMKARGIMPNRECYHAMIRAWTRSQNPDRACECLFEMEQAVGLWRDSYAFTVVGECCKENQYGMVVVKLWRSMKRNAVMPIKSHVLFFISMCVEQDRMKEATDIACQAKAFHDREGGRFTAGDKISRQLALQVQTLKDHVKRDKLVVQKEASRHFVAGLHSANSLPKNSTRTVLRR